MAFKNIVSPQEYSSLVVNTQLALFYYLHLNKDVMLIIYHIYLIN